MIQDRDLQFLCGKIKELHTATFINFSNAVLRLPSDLIEIAATDDAGNLWFAVQSPYICMDDVARSFAAALNFYNKSLNYRIAIQGNATIVNTDEEVPSNSANRRGHPVRFTIVNFQIVSAEYFCAVETKNNLVTRFFNRAMDILFLHGKPAIYKF